MRITCLARANRKHRRGARNCRAGRGRERRGGKEGSWKRRVCISIASNNGEIKFLDKRNPARLQIAGVLLPIPGGKERVRERGREREREQERDRAKSEKIVESLFRAE